MFPPYVFLQYNLNLGTDYRRIPGFIVYIYILVFFIKILIKIRIYNNDYINNKFTLTGGKVQKIRHET